MAGSGFEQGPWADPNLTPFPLSQWDPNFPIHKMGRSQLNRPPGFMVGMEGLGNIPPPSFGVLLCLGWKSFLIPPLVFRGFVFVLFCFSRQKVLLYHPGWNEVGQAELTAASTSQAPSDPPTTAS